MLRHSPFHFHACWPWELQPLNVQCRYLEVILILSFPQLLQNRINSSTLPVHISFGHSSRLKANGYKKLFQFVLFVPSGSTSIPSLTKRKTLTIWIVEKTNSEYWPNQSSYSELPEPAKRQQNCPSMFGSCSVLCSFKSDHWHHLPLKKVIYMRVCYMQILALVTSPFYNGALQIRRRIREINDGDRL